MRAVHTIFKPLLSSSRRSGSWWPILSLLLLITTLATERLQAQDVIRASGGTGISVDNVATETFVPLAGPTIRETAAGQLTAGGTIRLSLPSGYIFDTSSTITVLVEPMGAQNTKLIVNFTSISSTVAHFTVTTASSTGGAGQGPGRVTLNGLQVRPTSSAVPNSGQISNIGTTGPTNVSYGDLSTKAGSAQAVRVETAMDGSGVVIPDQTILAGQSVDAYAIGRDAGGNFIENIALTSESNWTLTGVTGSIQPSSLVPTTNLRQATFTPVRTGTARIRAFYSDVTLTESGTITVLPRPASTMEMVTQPSASATAGSAFATQPQIRLKDTYGNIVTNDNSTEVTAVIASGSGTLLGETTATASSGVVTFSDLQINQTGSITLRFESSGLSSLTSNTVTIGPASASQMIWLEQPTNTLPGQTITPAFELQMMDAYDNLVQQSGVNVTVDEEPDSESFLAGTLTVQTNSSGVAVFNSVAIQNDNNLSDEDDPVQVQAAFSGITTPAISDNFYILSSGSLVGFEITASGGGSIGTQTAGEAFGIDMRALDGEGDTFTDFTGTVEITSDSGFLQGGGTTASFTAGVLTGHTVSLSGSGEVRLTATSAAESRSGLSNYFTLQPGPVNAGESTLSVNQDELTADGESSTTVTIQLRDEYGNKLTSGGETVELATSAGTLSNGTEQDETRLLAQDQDDGTYTATITASSTVETATLQAWLGEESNDGELIDSATVEFVAGGVSEFVVTIPMSGETPVSQTAGSSFDVSVEAVDENGNRVTSFGGDLNFSTNSTISGGGTATMSSGYLENHSITLTTSGTAVTLTATLDDPLQITGESVQFSVVAASPSTSESQVVANPPLIQNNGAMQSTIVITMRDSYGNRVLNNLLPNVTLAADRLELNGSPSSGTPAASVGSLTFHAATTTYRATVTASNTIELVEFTGSVNASPIVQTAELDIVQPNTWTPSGAPQQQTDWNRPENWSLNRVPGENDFVIIPGGLSAYPDLDLNITIGSLLVEANGELVLFGGNFIDVGGETEINGILDIEDNTQLFVRGDFTGSGSFTGGESVSVELYGDVSIDNFFVRTSGSIVEFKGEELQTVEVGSFLAERIEIENDVLVNTGDLIDTNNLVISEGKTLELAEGAGIVLDTFEEITGLGTLILNDNTLVLGGNTDLSNFDTSEATVVFGVRSGEDPTQAAHLAQQQIGNLEQFGSVIINNDHGVRTFDNVQVSGTLTLENGDLIISSGQSLIAPDIVYTGGELTFRRTINEVTGWRMMSTPVATTFSDLFGGLVTQGIDGSTYPDDTEYQPSILWYLESHEGTDLQRWRKPSAMSATVEPGKGYFFYVFGDVDGEAEYSDTLPHVLTASGQEHTGDNGTFDFDVSYTDDGDKGWNLIGNPFGATLDWDDSGNWSKQHMDNAIYIWDPDASTYRTWNGIVGSLGSGRIAPFHAFWVKANPADPEVDTPSLTVSRDVKTTGGQFLQQAESGAPDPDEEWALELSVTAGGMEATTHFSFSEEGKVGPDRQDAWYLEPMPFEQSWLMFYSLNGEKEPMAIQNLPKRSRDPIEIPLGVGGYLEGVPVQGNYEIELGERTTLPEGWSVVLTDHRTGEQINLWDVESWVARVDQFREPQSRLRNIVTDTDVSTEKSMSATGRSSTVEEGGIAIPSYRLTPQPMALSSATLQSDHDVPFTITITADPLAVGDIPEELVLRQNFPNPFSGSTTIEYGIPSDLDQEKVELTLFTILGQRLETLVATEREAGYHRVVWDATRYASGVYLYRLRVRGKVLTGKMTHIK